MNIFFGFFFKALWGTGSRAFFLRSVFGRSLKAFDWLGELCLIDICASEICADLTGSCRQSLSETCWRRLKSNWDWWEFALNFETSGISCSGWSLISVQNSSWQDCLRALILSREYLFEMLHRVKVGETHDGAEWLGDWLINAADLYPVWLRGGEEKPGWLF